MTFMQKQENETFLFPENLYWEVHHVSVSALSFAANLNQYNVC